VRRKGAGALLCLLRGFVVGKEKVLSLIIKL
jgi:hypothetical protein